MPEPAPAKSIYILLLLFSINLMNFFDRTIPAVVLEPIRKEFGLDDTALGLLGASFTLIYAFAGVPLGYLSDRFRRTRILAAGLTAWSLLTAASGLAWNFMSFFWIRLLVGIGEASCAPAANSLIAVDSAASGGQSLARLDPNTALVVVGLWLVASLAVTAVFTERAEISG